jgi:hypothetical protein
VESASTARASEQGSSGPARARCGGRDLDLGPPETRLALRQRIRRRTEVADLLPSLRGLPESIGRDQIQADYGGLGGGETRRLLGEIDRRIAELPLYR